MRRGLVGAVVTLTVCGFAAPAWGTWTVSADGHGSGRGMTMPGGSAPTTSVRGADVVVRWPAAVLADGTPVAGYEVERLGPNGSPVGIGDDCVGAIAATTCTEHGVPAGTWTYVDVPLQESWSGAASPPSGPVVVTAPAGSSARVPAPPRPGGPTDR